MERTAELLAGFQPAIVRGELEGPPAIDPLILPTRTYSDGLQLAIAEISLELIHTNIHSDDATMIWLPEERLLLCGDTMEDTVTYVDEPDAFDVHLRNLEELHRLNPGRILPNHGDPDVIAAGGYSSELISATERYIRILMRSREEPVLRDAGLRELLAEPLRDGSDPLFRAVRAVHRENLETVLGR